MPLEREMYVIHLIARLFRKGVTRFPAENVAIVGQGGFLSGPISNIAILDGKTAHCAALHDWLTM